jgi:hypothetical protein
MLKKGCFVISWTPYVIVSMYSLFGDHTRITPLMATIPSLFGKSSLLWPSVLYIMSNRNIRNFLFKKPEPSTVSIVEVFSFLTFRFKI